MCSFIVTHFYKTIYYSTLLHSTPLYSTLLVDYFILRYCGLTSLRRCGWPWPAVSLVLRLLRQHRLLVIVGGSLIVHRSTPEAVL